MSCTTHTDMLVHQGKNTKRADVDAAWDVSTLPGKCRRVGIAEEYYTTFLLGGATLKDL